MTYTIRNLPRKIHVQHFVTLKAPDIRVVCFVTMTLSMRVRYKRGKKEEKEFFFFFLKKINEEVVIIHHAVMAAINSNMYVCT